MSFNTALAEKVLETIESVEQWHERNPDQRELRWEQGTWRTVNECGTGMCFAGMAVKISPLASYAVSDRSILELCTRGYQWLLEDYVVLDGEPTDRQIQDQIVFATEDRLGAERFSALKEDMAEIDPTWVVPLWTTTVCSAANELLGLDRDWLNMFDESQDLDSLRAIVAVYSTHGLQPSWDALWTYSLELFPKQPRLRKDCWNDNWWHVTGTSGMSWQQQYERREKDYAASLTTKEN